MSWCVGAVFGSVELKRIVLLERETEGGGESVCKSICTR